MTVKFVNVFFPTNVKAINFGIEFVRNRLIVWQHIYRKFNNKLDIIGFVGSIRHRSYFRSNFLIMHGKLSFSFVSSLLQPPMMIVWTDRKKSASAPMNTKEKSQIKTVSEYLRITAYIDLIHICIHIVQHKMGRQTATLPSSACMNLQIVVTWTRYEETARNTRRRILWAKIDWRNRKTQRQFWDKEKKSDGMIIKRAVKNQFKFIH